MKAEDLLNEDERMALNLAGQLATYVHRIIFAPSTKAASAEEEERLKEVATMDWNEAATHIHNIQRAIMAQAAARAFPERFRLLGAEVGGKR